jgi:hypothetical protein
MRKVAVPGLARHRTVAPHPAGAVGPAAGRSSRGWAAPSPATQTPHPASTVPRARVPQQREPAAERAATDGGRGRLAHRRPGSLGDRRCLLHGGVAVVCADRPPRGGSARDDPGRLRRRPCCGHASRRTPVRPARSPPRPAPRGRAPRRVDRRPRGPGHPSPALAGHARALLGAGRRLPGYVRTRPVRAHARHRARTPPPASQRRTHRCPPGRQPRRAADRRYAGRRRRAGSRLRTRRGRLRDLRPHPRVAAAGRRPAARTAHRAEAPGRARGDPGAAGNAHRRADRQPCLRRRIRRSPARDRSPALRHAGLRPGARRAGGRGSGWHPPSAPGSAHGAPP